MAADYRLEPCRTALRIGEHRRQQLEDPFGTAQIEPAIDLVGESLQVRRNGDHGCSTRAGVSRARARGDVSQTVS